jgi:hypothetical protein
MSGQTIKQWNRDTPWRQGSVLKADAAAALGLKNSTDETATLVVVISHDCDLANDNLDVEPNVELIVGRIVPAANGNFSWGKAPRTLHLPMVRDNVSVIVELVSTSKHLVPKSDLAQSDPQAAFTLDGKGLAVLRGWLSVRYNRTAFPDTFVKRMQYTKLDMRLAKVLEPYGELISFVYFDIDEGQLIERPEKNPYELSIVIVYPPGDDPEVSADAADKVVEAIEKICEERLKDKTDLILKSCISVSEDDLPVSKARVLMHWRLEHMTLKADGHPGLMPQ